MAEYINDVRIINPQLETLNGNTNNFKVCSSLLRINPTIPLNLSGLNLGGDINYNGGIILLTNVNDNPANVLTLLDNSNLSELSNRIRTKAGADVALPILTSVRLIYDDDPGRLGWWVI